MEGVPFDEVNVRMMASEDRITLCYFYSWHGTVESFFITSMIQIVNYDFDGDSITFSDASDFIEYKFMDSWQFPLQIRNVK
jgi:hypothetical protein